MRESFRQPLDEHALQIGDNIALGEDLKLQEKWWRFEHIVWAVFVAILICDLLGIFGRGWFAKAKASSADGAVVIDYERIERADTPSIMTLHFGPGAVHDGRVEVTISGSVIKGLGAQRISPQPVISSLCPNSLTYVWHRTAGPANAEIALQPPLPGLYRFAVQATGREPVVRKVFVFP